MKPAFSSLRTSSTIPYLAEDPLLLPNWVDEQAYIELVYHGTRANPWHVLVTPSKDISIGLQEEGKLFTNRRVGLCADTRGSAWDVVV